jgi:hypothetical protein
MTSLASLLASSAQDITLENVQGLVDQGLPEGLILDYKEAYSPQIVETVAAMANTYGGLILVGVTDSPPREMIGVDETDATRIANVCHDSLEPPWVPEIIPVPLDDKGRCLIVVRIDTRRAPRPVLHKGRAPVRLHDRVATADRDRLAQLFRETTPSTTLVALGVTPPQVQQEADGKPNSDFVIRSGMHVPLGEKASWRPFSDRVIERLALALTNSPIREPLLKWCNHLGIRSINPFHREGSTGHVTHGWCGKVPAIQRSASLSRPFLKSTCRPSMRHRGRRYM